MELAPSELVLNPDGSIYHLNLLPEDISDLIITVGDPDRVAKVSGYFDSVEVKKGKREFLTHSGVRNGRRVTVTSTGIGTDNVDIVLNELDALVNIDFRTRKPRENRIRFKIVRIGTSGAIQPEIQVDSFLLSEYALGFDGLVHYYQNDLLGKYNGFLKAFVDHTNWSPDKPMPYLVKCDGPLANALIDNRIRLGVTATNTGFYGPQGRQLRLSLRDPGLMDKIRSFSYRDRRITNLEMETSALYALAMLLGHRAVALNAILANRANGTFSENPENSVDSLIRYTLSRLTGS